MLLIQNYSLVEAPVNVRVTYPMRVIAGSSSNLSCTVQLSPAIDVPVNVSTEWSGPERIIFLPHRIVPAVMIDIATYTSTVTIDAARSGSYTCQATISSGGTMSGSANVTVGIFPSLYSFLCTSGIVFFYSSPPSPHQPDGNWYDHLHSFDLGAARRIGRQLYSHLSIHS